MEIVVLGKYQDDFGIWHVTYRYWMKGDCACGAVKIQRTFTEYPNREQLIKAI